MKQIRVIVTALSIMSAIASKAQIINWGNFDAQNKHIVNANIGAEYGLIYGLGYGYHVKSKLPIILNAEYSFSSGNKLTDDFKTKIGAKFRLYKLKNFHFSANIQGVFRRYENDFARILNFGSDFSGNIGYYKSKWFVAGEFGFDKAIVTNFKHSQFFKDNFPDVKGGWYAPTTGGNFYFGVQSGISFKQQDLYLKAGMIISQDFESTPSVPFYGQLGYNFKFRQVK